MILGIDLGNVNIKTSTGIIFENRLTKDERLYEDTENYKAEYEGEKYILGVGEYQTNYIKAQKKDIIMTLFSAVALSTIDNLNQVVVGLPIQQYKSDKDKLEELIIHNRIKDVKVNGKDRRILVTDLKVFPEGLATYYSLSNETRQQIGNRDIVIIDVGGRTTDVCLYCINGGKRKLMNYATIPAGTLNIYSDFIKAINDFYGLDKLKEDAPGILSHGLWVDGEKVELKFTKPIFEKYTERILGELRLNYPIRTAQCILCGGGGQLLKGLFAKEMKSLIIIDDIFCNAKGFAKVGENLWL
jgi:plasmid segregation protein ParM